MRTASHTAITAARTDEHGNLRLYRKAQLLAFPFPGETQAAYYRRGEWFALSWLAGGIVSVGLCGSGSG